MSRYRGPIKRLSRKIADGNVLDINPKFFGSTKRMSPPGKSASVRKKSSEYAIQLSAKQAILFTYGLREKQLRRAYNRAVRKKGVTGTILLQYLESRLDKIVYRSGLAATLPQARQLVCHGHIKVDGRKVDIASYEVSPGQIITIREKSKKFVKQLLEVNPYYTERENHWIEADLENFAAKFKEVPQREDLDPNLKEALVIEFYSR
ncbi:MAG: 30S ribosomal protein S4 [Cyanobacteria bacterium P01_H01_bin.74]